MLQLYLCTPDASFIFLCSVYCMNWTALQVKLSISHSRINNCLYTWDSRSRAILQSLMLERWNHFCLWSWWREEALVWKVYGYCRCFSKRIIGKQDFLKIWIYCCEEIGGLSAFLCFKLQEALMDIKYVCMLVGNAVYWRLKGFWSRGCLVERGHY